MTRSTAIALLVMGWTGHVALAQQPTTQPPTTQQQPRQQSALHALDGQTVTVTGCLKREADVAGQQPSAPERAGILPDFILTNVQVKTASPGGATAGRETAPAASASGMNIKLVRVENDEMKANLNRQVEVTGRIDATPGPGTASGTTAERPRTGTGTETPGRSQTGQRDRDELPELEVQSVRVTNQTCTPAK